METRKKTKTSKKLKKSSSSVKDPEGLVCSEYSAVRKKDQKKKRSTVSFRKENTNVGQSSLFSKQAYDGGVVVVADQETARTSRGVVVDQYEEEKEPILDSGTRGGDKALYEDDETQLFTDTFSFLMIATYPFEKKKKITTISPEKTTAKPKTDTATTAAIIDGSMNDNNQIDTRMGRNERKLRNIDPDSYYLPFVVGCGVLFLQIFIYVVVILATFRAGQPLPSDMLLRLAQGFALTVALYTQSDLVDAVFMLTEGSTIVGDEMTTPFKFAVSNVARFLAGNLGLVASFALVVYAVDVIELLLNFTAIEFVATLDDAAFRLASKGFLGIILKKKAKQVEDFRYPNHLRRSSLCIRAMVYLAYFLIYSGAMAVIVGLHRQRTLGLDNEVYVQFDDTQVPDLFGISGVYVGCNGYLTRRNKRKYTEKIGYFDASWHGNCPELVKTKTENGDDLETFPANSFYFCSEHNGWVFIKKPTTDPCSRSNHIIRSILDNGEDKPSDYFDILTHANAKWLIQNSNTQGEALLDSVSIMSVKEFSVSYNCTSGLEFLGDDNLFSFTLRTQLLPLPGSYYPIFNKDKEESKSYVEEFSLVYRQVFLGSTNIDGVNLSLSIFPYCDDNGEAAGEEELYTMVMFDGLRWYFLGDVSLRNFADWAKKKFNDAANEEDQCTSKMFLKYYLRDKSWMIDPAIARPAFVSDPMLFITPSDTGAPMKGVEWYEANIVYSRGLIRPGRSTNENGREVTNLEGSCLARTAECDSEKEYPFKLDLVTTAFPEETAILVQMNPSLQNKSLGGDYEWQPIEYYTEYFTNDATEIVRVTETSTLFSVSDKEVVKDFRFRDRETRYIIESCVPFVLESSFCFDVIVLNPVNNGLAPVDLGFGGTVKLGRDGEFINCRHYPVCYTKTTDPDPFSNDLEHAPRIFGPLNCTYSDIETLYPGIKTMVTF